MNSEQNLLSYWPKDRLLAAQQAFLHYTEGEENLSYVNFAKLLMECHVPPIQVVQYCKAVDLTLTGSITKTEFLLAAVGMDPDTPHQEPFLRLRATYIFRFWDADGDKFLNFQEFMTLIGTIRTFSMGGHQVVDPHTLLRDAEKINPTHSNISEQSFIQAILNGFPGTEKLCRLRLVPQGFHQPMSTPMETPGTFFNEDPMNSLFPHDQQQPQQGQQQVQVQPQRDQEPIMRANSEHVPINHRNSMPVLRHYSYDGSEAINNTRTSFPLANTDSAPIHRGSFPMVNNQYRNPTRPRSLHESTFRRSGHFPDVLDGAPAFDTPHSEPPPVETHDDAARRLSSIEHVDTHDPLHAVDQEIEDIISQIDQPFPGLPDHEEVEGELVVFDDLHLDPMDFHHPTPTMPTVIQDYDILKTLGTGTFASVLLARVKSDERTLVALKVLEKGNVVRCKQVSHTISERNILQQINFRHVAGMFGHFKDNSNLYLVLEYVGGGELYFHLRKKQRFPEEHIRFYGKEIGLALEYLHSKNIIYRDLKPENILLDMHGHLKLTDFGFAKTVEHHAWTVCGTPEYMAPEIILGKGYTLVVDWWAYGILLYEMAVGHPPFEGDNDIAIYTNLLRGEVTFNTSENCHLTHEFTNMILQLLQSDWTKRLGSVHPGVDGIKTHPWYGSGGWHVDYSLPGPILPSADQSNFEEYPLEPLRTNQVVEYESEFADF
eukprot:m.89610 g.89610  ORF g.89610 m.89610 type:complete len:715 (-) comp13231_c0_seq2:127-2271(-)